MTFFCHITPTAGGGLPSPSSLELSLPSPVGTFHSLRARCHLFKGLCHSFKGSSHSNRGLCHSVNSLGFHTYSNTAPLENKTRLPFTFLFSLSLLVDIVFSLSLAGTDLLKVWVLRQENSFKIFKILTRQYFVWRLHSSSDGVVGDGVGGEVPQVTLNSYRQFWFAIICHQPWIHSPGSAVLSF